MYLTRSVVVPARLSSMNHREFELRELQLFCHALLDTLASVLGCVYWPRAARACVDGRVARLSDGAVQVYYTPRWGRRDE